MIALVSSSESVFRKLHAWNLLPYLYKETVKDHYGIGYYGQLHQGFPSGMLWSQNGFKYDVWFPRASGLVIFSYV